jgi:nucleotide-binding universal stress UspA family protein
MDLQVVPADAPGSLGGAGRMQEAVDHDIAYLEKQHPELTILRQVTFVQPRTALLDATAEAQLIVVGNRGRGGISGMLLGSVAQAIIHHASETGAAMGRISCQHGTLAGQSLTLGG